MDESTKDGEPEFTESLRDHDELVQRFADGDVHSLDSLIESVAGVRVVSSRTIIPTP